MPPKLHRHAFRVEYPGLVREIATEVFVAWPCRITTPHPEPQKFRCVWDTGATTSAITPKVAESLRLIPTGKTDVRGAHGSQLVRTYLVDFIFPFGPNYHVAVRNVKVTACDFSANDVQVLIGMNVIMLGDFSISNPKGKTVFSFCVPPHDNPVDLVEKSDCVNRRKA